MEDPAGIAKLFSGKSKLSDFLITIPGSLDPDFCNGVIEKYKKNRQDVVAGTTIGGVQPEYQSREMIEISYYEHWKEEDEVFNKTINETIKNTDLYFETNRVKDSGYLITHQDSKGYYHWHHDSYWEGEWSRFYTFMWYLNTLEDGYTEFLFGEKVYPETGKLLLFPSSPLFVHRTTSTALDKYICTGWLYTTCFEEPNEQ